MTHTHGHNPSLQPPRTQPGPPPAPADPITYADLQVSLHLGRGVVIDTAPQHTKIYVGMLDKDHLGISLDNPGRIKFAYQVEYEITGYDPTDCTLTLSLVNDWRPGGPDAPEAEPLGDLDITPYLVVHHYRRDQGDWAWMYRCWGDAGCDGFLSLDWSTRDTAEREARAHLAGHPAVPSVKEG